MGTTNLVVVHKRLARWPVDAWLGEVASEVVLVTTRQAHSKGGNYAAFRDVILVDDYLAPSTSGVIRRAAEAHAVERVAGCAEVDVRRLADVRDELALPGLSGPAARTLTDKLHMRERAKGAGLASPEFWAPTTVEASSLAQLFRSGRTLIAKPREDSGSRGVSQICGSQELESWLTTNRSSLDSFLIEEFIPGPLIHVDGLSHNGSVVHAWPSEYGVTPLRARQTRMPLTSWMLDASDERAGCILQFTEATIDAMPPSPDVCAFHLELILRSPHDPVFCEIGMRPAGGGTDLAWEAAFGTSPIHAHLLGQLGRPIDGSAMAIPSTYAGWSMLFSLNERIELMPPLPKSLSPIHSGLPRPGPLSSSTGDAAGIVVLKAPSVELVKEDLQSVTDWWMSSIKWATTDS